MLNLAQKLTNVQKLELTILQLYYKNSQYNTSFKEDVLMLITSDLKRINNTNQCYIAVVNEIKQLLKLISLYL